MRRRGQRRVWPGVLLWVRRGVAALWTVLLLAVAGVAGALWLSFPLDDGAWGNGTGADGTGADGTGVPGLEADVRITVDADGIPRVAAGSERDGAAALGYLHARDRMFQLELMRRNASGRLSEVAGAAALPQDRLMRTLGLRRRAEADLAGLDPATRGMLDAYAAGVNAWIRARGRLAAPEFIVIGPPEPWTAVDSLLWGKTMGLYLSGNWRLEVARAALLARQPGVRVQEYWPPQDGTPAVEASLGVGVESRLAEVVPAFPAPFTLPDQASNEWAVDGTHSVSGAPLLAGDPHLGFSMPGIWYLARVDTPAGVLAGATAPGVPFLVMGHNGRIAWAFTTTGADTQDVFVETVLPDGNYASPQGPRPFVVREERIRVRGRADEVLRVRETRHGPVLSDLDAPGGPVLAVAMANLLPGDSAPGLLALNRAGTTAEAGLAAAGIVAPVQNMLVADRDGIAQFTTGRVPVRAAGDGSVPVAGADGAHDWVGMAGGDALPHQVAPASGRLVNANERTAAPDFPVFMGRDWYGDWRARRIRTLLDGLERHDAAGFAAMQVDSVSSYALEVLPRLLATAPADAASVEALGLLRGWDGAMQAELPQPLLFNEWMRAFEGSLLQGAGVPVGLTGTRYDLVAYALSPAGAWWCRGDCGAQLSASLGAAVSALAARQGPGAAGWRWGAEHRAAFAHPLLGLLPGVGRLATWSIEQPGDDTTLNRGGTRAGSWASVHGAGFRGVYDLADLDGSLFAQTPGQSGHSLRRTAASLLERWRDGVPVRLGPRGDAVADTLVLRAGVLRAAAPR